MFRSFGPFKHIDCPQESECSLLNCIFRHPPLGPSDVKSDLPHRPSETPNSEADGNGGLNEDGRPAKKRRLSTTRDEDPVINGSILSSKISKTSKPEHDALKRASHGAVVSGDHASSSDQRSKSGSRAAATEMSRTDQQPQVRTRQKTVSPPPLKRPETKSLETAKAAQTDTGLVVPLKRKRAELKTEALHPRPVPKAPAPYGTRLKLLTLLHEQVVRLDGLVRESSDAFKDALTLSKQELIKMTLDEEEQAARANSSIYANVIKLRISALKKMRFVEWRAERIKQIEHEQPELKKPRPPARIESGLAGEEEISMLASLITSQDGLSKHGYVTAEIEQMKIEEARKGLESARGFEVCDRCATRFQVFPGRREDGLLTTGGECTYHPGRLRRPVKERGRTAQSDRYTCCQDEAGSGGCTKAKHHVFKVSDPTRLAAILPFQRTPANSNVTSSRAVCFDCEMGYTTRGMELIRLTATAWPSGQELIDVLVRPLGEILDLNSTFSGVWPEQFMSAQPYTSKQSSEGTDDGLCIAQSISAARDLLFQQLSPKTPLIGHALENDLNAVRIIHPTIIDTVLLYPHPRGLPIRHGLKYLAKTYLEKDIQMGGAQGHDSKEDARAAGDLVRFRVAEKWKRMRQEGWTVTDGVFNPPKSGSK